MTMTLALSRRAVTKKQFGQRLRELRVASGMTRPELAEASGVSLRVIEAIEQGVREVGSLKLPKLAKALGVDANAFYIYPDPHTPPAKRGRPPGQHDDEDE